MLVCQLSFGQAAKQVFDEYKAKEGANYVSIPSALIQLAAIKVKDDKVKDVVRQVKSARVLMMDDCKKSVRKNFVKDIQTLTKKGYDPMTAVRDDDSNTLIYTKGDDDVLKEVVILINDADDITAVLFTGSISTESISALIGLAGEM